MLQGLVEGLFSVSMSLILLSSRIDFFFVIRFPPSKSLTQMNITNFGTNSVPLPKLFTKNNSCKGNEKVVLNQKYKRSQILKAN